MNRLKYAAVLLFIVFFLSPPVLAATDSNSSTGAANKPSGPPKTGPKVNDRRNFKPAKAPESERDKLFWERTRKIRAANAAAKNRSRSNKNKGSDRSRFLKINSPPPAPDDQYFRPVKAPKNKQLKQIQPTKSIARTIESNDISPSKKDSNDILPSKAKHKKYHKINKF